MLLVHPISILVLNLLGSDGPAECASDLSLSLHDPKMLDFFCYALCFACEYLQRGSSRSKCYPPATLELENFGWKSCIVVFSPEGSSGACVSDAIGEDLFGFNSLNHLERNWTLIRFT